MKIRIMKKLLKNWWISEKVLYLHLEGLHILVICDRREDLFLIEAR
jgi:hypothetical protein